MITISNEAAAHLHELLDPDNPLPGLRLSVMGSSGFGLTPDKAQESDHITLSGEIEIFIDKKLLDFCQSIAIDFNEGNPQGCSSKSGRGFVITAENPVIF